MAVTNPTPSLMASIDKIPNIEERKNTDTNDSSLLTRKQMKPSNNSIEQEPLFIVAKIYQSIKKTRQEINEAKNAT